MPDVSNRDQLESRLARVLSRELSSALRDLIDALGDPPDEFRLPANFWSDKSQEMRNLIEPILRDIYTEQAELLQSGITIRLETDIANEAAANWARQYSYDLVTNMTTTRRGKLQRYLGEYYERGYTMEQLEDKLKPWFNGRNAARIAVTEVTRAAASGEVETARLIMQETPEIEIIQIWQTNNDELSANCPICGPRHNKITTDYPPAHPNCRCWLTQKVRLRK